MKVSSICLVLLVLLTPLDDIAALATPTTDDDDLAAQNNDFLPGPAGQIQTSQREVAPLPPGHRAPARADPMACPRDWRATPRRGTGSGPELRCLLQSLLR
jgi:hypothetical protein